MEQTLYALDEERISASSWLIENNKRNEQNTSQKYQKYTDHEWSLTQKKNNVSVSVVNAKGTTRSNSTVAYHFELTRMGGNQPNVVEMTIS